MKKSELISAIASASGETKACVSKVLDIFMEKTIEELKAGGQVILPGFASFSITHRSERTGRNPQTGATIKIPAARVPKLKAGKNLKDAVQGS